MGPSGTPNHRTASPALLAFLAWRDLGATPLTAVVLVGAVAAGVGFQVPNTANILGYEAEMIEEGVKPGSGDVRAYPRNGRRIDDASVTLERVRAVPGVKGVAGALILPALVGRGEQFQSGAA